MQTRSLLWKTALNRFFDAHTKDKGAELVEFAISLPFLVLLVVGTYDFGAAFTLRAKLNSAADEGAKVASRQTTTDLQAVDDTCGAPASVCSVRDVVDFYIVQSGVNDCGLQSATATPVAGLTRAWKFDVTCGGTLELQIERAAWFPADFADPLSPGYGIEASKITLSYPYRWQFGRVAGFFGGTFIGSDIRVTAMMQNLN